MNRKLWVVVALCSLAASCTPVDDVQGEGLGQPFEELKDQLTDTQKRAHCDLVKVHAEARGLTNSVLPAGVANHETGMVQCWKDNTIHCQGPSSTDCGGPVLAGSGDGACSLQEGGLGMFQFDSGTHSQTLAAYGQEILTVSGNARKGVDTVISKVRGCPNMSGRFASDGDVIAWMNTARPGTQAFEDFLTSMAYCYNGCLPGWSCHSPMREKYRAGIMDLLNKFGESYWYGSGALRAAPQRAARDALGRMVAVWRRPSDGRVFHRVLASTGWGAWTELAGGGILVEEPVVARNQNGRLVVFGIGSDRALYIQSQTSDTAWSGVWVKLGGSFASHVAVGQNADGRLEAFGRGTNNGLWRTNQTAVNGTGWTAPVNMGGVLTSDPAVARDAAGLLNVFLVGTEGRFFRIQQLNGQWTTFLETTGLKVSSAPSVARRSDGRLIVFARSQSNNELVRQEQGSTTAGSGYSGWTAMGGVLTSAPNAIYNETTRLVEVFVRNVQGGAHRISQTSSTGWGAWIDMSGAISGAPSAALNAGLRPEVFVVGNEGLYRKVQTSTGGWPTNWELIGRP